MTGHKDAEAAVTVRLDTIRRGYTRAIHWLLFVERNCAASASGNPPASRPTDTASLIIPKRYFKSSIRRLDSNLTKCKVAHCLHVNMGDWFPFDYFPFSDAHLFWEGPVSRENPRLMTKFLNVQQLLQYSSGSHETIRLHYYRTIMRQFLTGSIWQRRVWL